MRQKDQRLNRKRYYEDKPLTSKAYIRLGKNRKF